MKLDYLGYGFVLVFAIVHFSGGTNFFVAIFFAILFELAWRLVKPLFWPEIKADRIAAGKGDSSEQETTDRRWARRS